MRPFTAAAAAAGRCLISIQPIAVVVDGGASAESAALWRMQKVVDARLPTLVRRLLDQGVDLAPAAPSGGQSVQFTVPQTQCVLDEVRAAVLTFVGEAQEYTSGVASAGSAAHLRLTMTDSNGEHCGPAAAALAAVEDYAEAAHRRGVTSSKCSPIVISALDAAGRAVVHNRCEELGLRHASQGTGSARVIVVRVC